MSDESWVRKALCLIGAFLLLTTHGSRLTAVFAEELNVVAQVDKTEVATGETLVFSITIAGSVRQTPKVQLTHFEGFKVVSTGQSQQIKIQAGQTHQALTLNYTLAPTAVGTHTLGAVKVEYEGQVYQTQPIQVEVVSGPREEAPEPGPLHIPQLEGELIL